MLMHAWGLLDMEYLSSRAHCAPGLFKDCHTVFSSAATNVVRYADALVVYKQNNEITVETERGPESRLSIEISFHQHCGALDLKAKLFQVAYRFFLQDAKHSWS